MDKFLNIVHKIGVKFVAAVSLVMMAGISIASFFIQSRNSLKFDNVEQVTFHSHHKYIYICFAAFVLILLLTKKLIARMDGKKLYAALAVIYSFFGVIFILGLSPVLRADAASINQAAQMFAAGDYKMLEIGGYMSRYPHQLGMVTYERILRCLSENTKIFFIANFLFTLLINFTSWKITCLLFPKRQYTQNLALILSFAFLPQFFFIAFVYGLIPGFAMLLLAVYFQLLYFKEKKLVYLIPTALFAGLACIFKSNYLIGVVALFLVFLLESLKSKNWKPIAAGLAVTIIALSGTSVVNTCYEKVSGEKLNAEPQLLWIAMGLRDESGILGGWYDSYNMRTFKETGYDAEKSNELAKESIAQSIDGFKADPAHAKKFFGQKIASTWCDPLFESVFSGPLKSYVTNVYGDERVSDIYDDETVIHKEIKGASQVIMMFMYAMMTLFLIKALIKKDFSTSLFGVIFFIGGFLFHIVWETKSQYVYPYIFAMIPYMASAFDSVSAIAKKACARGVARLKEAQKK